MLCQGILCFVVGDAFEILVQVHVASAKISVRPALPRPVSHLLCNRQVLRVARYGLRIVPQRTIRVAEVPVRPALPARSPTSFAIARSCVWYSIAFS
jgi:hypothetical protein